MIIPTDRVSSSFALYNLIHNYMYVHIIQHCLFKSVSLYEKNKIKINKMLQENKYYGIMVIRLYYYGGLNLSLLCVPQFSLC